MKEAKDFYPFFETGRKKVSVFVENGDEKNLVCLAAYKRNYVFLREDFFNNNLLSFCLEGEEKNLEFVERTIPEKISSVSITEDKKSHTGCKVCGGATIHSIAGDGYCREHAPQMPYFP